jgi:hypothetical protein
MNLHSVADAVSAAHACGGPGTLLSSLCVFAACRQAGWLGDCAVDT